MCAFSDKAESLLGAPGPLEGLSDLLCPSLFPGPESIQPGPPAGPMHATKWARHCLTKSRYEATESQLEPP
ncbi:hypothetical protein SRM_01406 [Salinibacter ruber M8]|uniref:Uncharacterized protein n=1 Tax=Salinibacter ruber (strain M8) TaxID=761659 RepID=D5H8H2_SALRM|nr:hypothetical protein SRM_01406 [Salinibacter ruber M8]